ncbi:hypothetical protein Fbal_0585 [Ferrimonas balearica DSM 9799]|uniref:Uncharacterized protein n=1 Tax=Ferrimonas balearica (strain DSM 9799 / CCM 4581 / KCTC 23876 / PAT) TaxID=550540 RepID=E1SQI7_FERBD|nr:hypothetical protein [Ferrimonas balearica]ADN74799.1 hypothetical protein Fbal_0585 [Ferrimonas balearica DSM 9799]
MTEPQLPHGTGDDTHWRDGDLGAALVELLESALTPPQSDSE